MYIQNIGLVRKRYGVIQYDKDLISELIQETKSGKILEVGIGDGHPYSGFSQRL